MAYFPPMRTLHGVPASHRAFECDAACDKGQIERGRSPADEGWETCRECDGVGRYSTVACSDCNDLIVPEEVRSIDNAYVYCGPCTEKLHASEVA